MKTLALLMLALPGLCYAQPEAKEKESPSVYMLVLPEGLEVYVAVQRDLMEPLRMKPSDVTLKYLPSGKTVPGSLLSADGLRPGLGDAKQLIMDFPRTDLTKPERGDQKLMLLVNGIVYEGATDPVTIKVEGVVYDSSNIQSLVKATGEALAPAKTTEEKDLFAGLNVAVPSSTGGVQGDVVFNRTLASVPAQLQGGIADTGMFGVKLKKGSEDGKDPRYFNMGFHFRKTVLLANRADLAILRSAIAPGARRVPSQDALNALGSVRSRFFRAFLADYGFQMEGDVSDKGVGNVSNLVLDAMPQVATAAKNAFGEKGFFTLRFMPAGIELGRNLTNPDKQTKEVGSVARYKAGAELRFYYEDKEEASFIRRVELTAATTYRRLFQNEIAYDSKEKKNVSTASGDKLWTQVDFKMFLGPAMGKIRPGLKVTYQRGYLPPVWVRTKVFTYGLVFESSE